MPPIAPLSIDQGLRSGSQTYNPMAGTGFGGGGGIMDILIQMLGQKFISDKGMMPLGVTQQNVYDRFQSFKLQQLHDSVMADAAKQDVDTMMKITMGFRRVAGMPTSPQMYRELEDTMKTGAGMLPALMQFPGMPSTIDTMFGYRGSSTVMSHFMLRGGRFRADPFTGEQGLGKDALERLNKDVFQSMFAGNNFTQQMMSAGRTGMMFDELQQLGLMPGGQVTLRDLARQGGAGGRDALIKGFKDIGRDVDPKDLRKTLSGLSPAQTQQLTATEDVQNAIKAFDSQRVIRGLEKYSGAVKAMREIFGGAGKPNAPMPQLMNALNQLTGGAFTQMEPGQAEMTVRRIHNLARNAGLNLEATMLYSQVAAQQAQSMGLDPTQTSGVLESMLQTRGAIQNLGWGGGGFGQLNIHQATQQRGFLAAAARQSRAAKQMAAATRISDTFGGKAFREGTAAKRYIDAIKAGQPEFIGEDGEITSVAMEHSTLIEMLTAGADKKFNIDRAFILRRLGERGPNLEFQQKYKTGATAEAAQPDEWWKLAAASGQVDYNVMGRLQSLGVARGKQERIKEMVVEAGIDVAKRIKPEGMLKKDRDALIGEAIKTRLKQAAAAGDDEAQKLLDKGGDFSGLATELWSGLDKFSQLKKVGFGEGVKIQHRIKQMHEDMAAARAQAGARSQAQAVIQHALAPLGGRGSMLQKAMQAVIDADAGADKGKIFAKTFGGIDQKDFVEALEKGGKGSALNELWRKSDALKTIMDQFNKADPKQKQQLHKRIGRARAALDREAKKFAGMAGKFNQLPGQQTARIKAMQVGLGALAKMPGALGWMGQAGVAALSAKTDKAGKIPGEGDGEDDKEFNITIKIGTIKKDGPGAIITGKGKGKLPVDEGGMQ